VKPFRTPCVYTCPRCTCGSGCISPNSVLRFVYEYKDSVYTYRLCFIGDAHARPPRRLSAGVTRRRHGGGSHERGACARVDPRVRLVRARARPLPRRLSRERARERDIRRRWARERVFERGVSIDRSRDGGGARGIGSDGSDGADVFDGSAVTSRARGMVD
jgi:hypothetical protein